MLSLVLRVAPLYSRDRLLEKEIPSLAALHLDICATRAVFLPPPTP